MTGATFVAPGYVTFRHFDGTCWAYADGHVKWMKKEATYNNDGWLWRITKP